MGLSGSVLGPGKGADPETWQEACAALEAGAEAEDTVVTSARTKTPASIDTQAL